MAFSLKKITTVTVKEANIEDTDEYLKIKDITTQVKIKRKSL